MKYLFANFLSDIQEYRASQAFWKDLCLQILSQHQQSDWWVEKFGVEETDEKAILHEGNPIYSLVNLKQLKGVRIIQQDPKIHTKWEMAAWINISGDKYSEPGIINELVFTCNLSLKSAEVFKTLFEVWIQPESKVQTIKELIKNFGLN